MEPADLTRLERAAAQAFGDAPVAFAYLFGSHARGRTHADSDLDVAVFLSEPVADAHAVASRLTDELTAIIRFAPIEVVVLNDLPLRVVGRVLREGRVLFSADEAQRISWESLTSRMADDLELWAAPLDQELLRARAAEAGR